MLTYQILSRVEGSLFGAVEKTPSPYTLGPEPYIYQSVALWQDIIGSNRLLEPIEEAVFVGLIHKKSIWGFEFEV